MLVETRDFGSITTSNDEVIQFNLPIFGFEEYRDYIVIQDPDIGENIVWLQSVQRGDLCFILMNPQLAKLDYTPTISEENGRQLKRANISNPVYWVIAVIPNEFRNTTVNLKSPILIDWDNKCAAQIILDDDYPIRAPLIPAGKGNDNEC